VCETDTLSNMDITKTIQNKEIQSRCFMRFMVKPYIFSEADLILMDQDICQATSPERLKLERPEFTVEWGIVGLLHPDKKENRTTRPPVSSLNKATSLTNISDLHS